MEPILHATFARGEDGIRAVEALLHRGARASDINLILPQLQRAETMYVDAASKATEAIVGAASGKLTRAAAMLAAERTVNDLLPQPPQLSALLQHKLPPYAGDADQRVSHAPGYCYDALGAVIPDAVPTKTKASPPGICHESVPYAKERATLGLLFGVPTAACVPDIGLIAGSGTIAAGLMAAGTGIGGLAGGLYGYLLDRQIDREIARKLSDDLAEGRGVLSVSMSGVLKEAEIVGVLRGFGGHLIRQSGE